MNNNIFEKIALRIPQQFYGGPSTSFKIRGVLLEKNDHAVKLSIGGEKILEAELKEPIKGEVGDSVVIDKKNIVKSKLVEGKNQAENPSKKEALPASQEIKEATKALEKFGINTTKENLQHFIASKGSLEKIIEGLDYETAIKLMEKNIDISKESLPRLADMLEEIKNQREGFSLSKLFSRKKNMTTEEAEKTASRLYGNKMGKDITDIIKELHKAGVEVTRGTVERVNDVFAKLENLQSIEEDTIIDALKNKIESSIDYLYKLKNAVVKSTIAAEEKVSNLATKAYGALSLHPESISERDLQRMEEDIKQLLAASDMEGTEDKVRLAKELIKNGLEVTKENIERVEMVKTALGELNRLLTPQRAAEMMKDGVMIEKENVVTLVQLIKDAMAKEALEGSTEIIDKELGEEKANSIVDTIKSLQKIDEKQLLQMLKKGADFKLSSLEFLVAKNATKEISLEALDENMRKIYSQHVKTLQAFQQLETVSLNTIAFHMKNARPNTLNGLITSHRMAESSGKIIEDPQEATIKNHIIKNADMLGVQGRAADMEAARALFRNSIALNKGNMMGLYEMNSHIENIRNNLSSHIVKDLVQKGATLEDMEIAKLSSQIDESLERTDGNKKMENAKELLQNIGTLGQQKEAILTLMMKNAIPIDLKEVQHMNLFLLNKQQIAGETDKILKLLENSKEKDLKDLEKKLKGFLKETTEAMKAGRYDAVKTYQQLSKWLKEVEGKAHLMEDTTREAFQRNNEGLKDSLALQQQLNKEDTLLQLPIMMENQVKNLQIYIMNKKKGSRRVDPNDMSILLNFDTNNMGNINIYTAVQYKNVGMKIGVKSQEDKNLFEAKRNQIEGLLKELGYELKEMSFKVEEEIHLFSTTEEIDPSYKPAKSFLDIKI
ncbi:hypothetical protein SAMN05660297_00756 [Natronincola peptidivorans]|uniref:Hook-length control protein FliK n=1 Tax=Natronincola peptidivorans TaxID=426128 RepID=A0A1H9ZZ24_9FIRM|nr:DUF6240 domain-containing protein [Natronincola peptidivorans]SES86156.1 hypothetical protein SAMN05660297_00756 [Natronincola peptidivorans]